jgi:hypothetical protein
VVEGERTDDEAVHLTVNWTDRQAQAFKAVGT